MDLTQKVWIENADGLYESAVISNQDDKSYYVVGEVSKEEVRVPLQDIQFQNPSEDEGIDDMLCLHHLHPPALLHNLSHRFKDDNIYTYTGRMTISVNPYKWLPLYEPDLRKTYHANNFSSRPPHVYSVAERAFRGIVESHEGQSVVVSGESGAGKTEATKIVMRYLTSRRGGTDEDGPETISGQILQANPLLEAFGNAKTLRNDNSSRFGKHIEMFFSTDGRVEGAATTTYLLEKSRVIGQAAGERNYHIFYQMLRGLPAEVLCALGLQSLQGMSPHRYIGETGEVQVREMDDATSFEETVDAFRAIGLTDADKDNVFEVLAAVLLLGDIDFVDKDDEGCEVAATSALDVVAQRLSCEAANLRKALTERLIQLRTETYYKPLTAAQANNTRDALAKALYGKLFDWLVRRINTSMTTATTTTSRLAVGLLDIFGFESFEQNSFEQLCINYANEKLQQQFTQDTFKAVQEEYNDEGIRWNHIDFPDNQEGVEVIEKKLGILALLDEECAMPKGSDVGLVQKMYTLLGQHSHFAKPKFGESSFVVRHYAADVCYATEGFLEKNRDALLPDVVDLVRSSRSSFVSGLFSLSPGATPSRARPGKAAPRQSKLLQPTVAAQFKGQLAVLMEKLRGTSVQYIRCIKPNIEASPHLFDERLVRNQLQYCGVLEVIRISRVAYPYHLAHDVFCKRYALLAPGTFLPPASDRKRACAWTSACERLAEHLFLAPSHTQGTDAESQGSDVYQVGRTKIYMRAGVMERLEEQRAKLITARVIQLQAIARTVILRRRYRLLRGRSIRIQAAIRMFLQKNRYRRIRQCLIRTQAVYRGVRARRLAEKLRLQRAATRIQAVFRGTYQRRRYLARRRAAIRLQAYVRMFLCVGRYRVLLVERREEAKLENQLKLLQDRLEAEIAARAKAESKLAEERRDPMPAAAVASAVRAASVGEASGAVSVEGVASAVGVGSVAVPGDVLGNAPASTASAAPAVVAAEAEVLIRDGGAQDGGVEIFGEASDLIRTLQFQLRQANRKLAMQSETAASLQEKVLTLNTASSNWKVKYEMEAAQCKKLQRRYEEKDEELQLFREAHLQCMQAHAEAHIKLHDEFTQQEKISGRAISENNDLTNTVAALREELGRLKQMLMREIQARAELEGLIHQTISDDVTRGIKDVSAEDLERIRLFMDLQVTTPVDVRRDMEEASRPVGGVGWLRRRKTKTGPSRPGAPSLSGTGFGNGPSSHGAADGHHHGGPGSSRGSLLGFFSSMRVFGGGPGGPVASADPAGGVDPRTRL
eukprot:Rmarinus@m.12264